MTFACTQQPVVGLRDFSAPVKLTYQRDDSELLFLMAHDSDAFNRWEAGQTLMRQMLLTAIAKHRTVGITPAFINALRDTDRCDA